MSRSWDINAFSASSNAGTTPTLSRKRGKQFRAAVEFVLSSLPTDAPSGTPFPSAKSDGVEDATDEKHQDPDVLSDDASTGSNTLRTVRRKKSSVDLRDVFLSTEYVPAESTSSS